MQRIARKDDERVIVKRSGWRPQGPPTADPWNAQEIDGGSSDVSDTAKQTQCQDQAGGQNGSPPQTNYHFSGKKILFLFHARRA